MSATATLNTAVTSPSLAQQLHAIGERLLAARDNESHAIVHNLEMGLVDLMHRFRDAERVLKGSDAQTVQQLKAVLFESAGSAK